MSEKSIRSIVYVIMAGLFVLPVLSLLVSNSLFFPFITTKNFFFRMVVEILFFLWVLVAVFDKKYRPKVSPLLIAVSLTLLVLCLATIFGANPYRSFWSNYERMEGLAGHLHLFAYFLVLTSILRRKKDWIFLFGAMIGVSFIASFYALLQFFGVVDIHQSSVRLDATLGNATYLAIFLIFHLCLISLFFFWFRNKWLRIGLGLLFLLETAVVFLTATRGAILGLLGSLFLLGILMAVFSGDVKIRRVSVGILLFIVLIVFLFLILKNQPFIKNNYVLSRFANISFSEGTVESRFTIWGMSWQGLQEHPLLGWGPENYNLVFNKYYQPKLYKQEPWFDRSHNVIFDWLITGGILGFLAYASIFISALYIVWLGYKKNYFALLETALITSLLAAYAFHNLFVFDNLTSYFMFFSVLGFIHFVFVGNQKEEKKIKETNKEEISLFGYMVVTFSFILVVFSLYFVNIKPLLACNKLLSVLYAARQGVVVDTVLKEFDKVFKYNTFGTGEAREQLVSYANNIVFASNISQQDKVKVLTKAIEEMEKQSLSSPDDIRYLIMLGSLYNKAGRVGDALKVIDRAIVLSPNKQQLYFVKIEILFVVEQNQEALVAAKKAYDLDSSYAEAAKNLAIAYIVAGDEKSAEELLLKTFSRTIIADGTLMAAYARMGNYEKVKQIWEEFINQDPGNAQYHVNLSATYYQLGEKEKAINELQIAIQLNPQFKQQGEYYINEIVSGRTP
ncbi:O-antigen ligase family protein [Patescibacteria group bacterium]|nr:O-antigen ligase family protein [Patescibacteria group bacterium]